MDIYKKIVRPLVFKMDPELAHQAAISAGKYINDTWMRKPVEWMCKYEDDILKTELFGVELKNPVGLAAGYDKNGEFLDFVDALGFGFSEIGSATALGGPGNPRPRLFRLPEDNALINRMGLNGLKAEKINEIIRAANPKIPFAINIAKTHNPEILGDKAIRDFCHSYSTLNGLGFYTDVNTSCPNTREGMTFEDPVFLAELLSGLGETERSIGIECPMTIKLSPDLYESLLKVDRTLKVAEDYGIDGYVIGNTSSKREKFLGYGKLRTHHDLVQKIGKGGLSGDPLKQKSTDLIRYVYGATKKPIIGVGGVSSAKDAYHKITAGASAVQLLTGLIYEGPTVAKKINKGLAELLQMDGHKSVKEAVGKYATF